MIREDISDFNELLKSKKSKEIKCDVCTPNSVHVLEISFRYFNDWMLYIYGPMTNALIDTVLMVTYICETFYKSLEHNPVIRDYLDYTLWVYGAGGNVLPGLGS